MRQDDFVSTTYSFAAELREWESTTSWFLLSLPETDAADIEERFGRPTLTFIED